SSSIYTSHAHILTRRVTPPISILLTHFLLFFFFTPPPTPEIYTLSLHDALPISPTSRTSAGAPCRRSPDDRRSHRGDRRGHHGADRKSTRLNSSHVAISYAVFCLKKKKKNKIEKTREKRTDVPLHDVINAVRRDK